MTITCTAFRCTPLPDGQVRLEIEQPKPAATPHGLDPNSSTPLYYDDVAAKLRVHRKTVEQRGRRAKNPIPFVKGRGKPYILESSLCAYLASNPLAAATRATFA